MLSSFARHYNQLRAVKSAMESLPELRPDGKTAAEVAARVAAAEELRGLFHTDTVHVNKARARLSGLQNNAHRVAVAVYATLGSCYRDDAHSLEAIVALPVKDRTATETLARMEAISKLWERLPNPPGMSTPMLVGAMDRAAFEALAAELRVAQSELVAAEQQYKVTSVASNKEAAAMERFVSAALIQGRAIFGPDTPQRRLIDNIRPKRSRTSPVNSRETAPAPATVPARAA